MLMVTPQFAAGAGIVIAAMLAVDAPHAALTYGPNPLVRKCAAAACSTPSPAPGLATAQPSIKFQAPRPRVGASAAAATTPAAVPPARPSRPQAVIEYRTIRTFGTGFIAMITIRSDGKPGAWSLMLTFADAEVQHVLGADWQPDSSGDGGVATAQPWPWPGPKPGTSRVVIFASGRSSTPTSCSFDGGSCRFG